MIRIEAGDDYGKDIKVFYKGQELRAVYAVELYGDHCLFGDW